MKIEFELEDPKHCTDCPCLHITFSLDVKYYCGYFNNVRIRPGEQGKAARLRKCKIKETKDINKEAEKVWG